MSLRTQYRRFREHLTDRKTGRRRGFAFVEMGKATAADDAICALDLAALGLADTFLNDGQSNERILSQRGET